MFKVSEVRRTTTCLTCRGPIAPKELQVSFGKYFQHLHCLSTLQPLTLEMFWSSPELSAAGARRLAAFVKGTSSDSMASGSTDPGASDINATKSPPISDSSLVLRLRIPRAQDSGFSEEARGLEARWHEAPQNEMHHREDDEEGPSYSSPICNMSSLYQLDHASAGSGMPASGYTPNEYSDWNQDATTRWMSAEKQRALADPTPLSVNPPASPSTRLTTTSPFSFGVGVHGVGGGVGISSPQQQAPSQSTNTTNTLLFQDASLNPKTAPSAALPSESFHPASAWPHPNHRSQNMIVDASHPVSSYLSTQQSHTAFGVSRQIDGGETGHSQDFSLTPISSRAPLLSAQEGITSQSISAGQPKYPHPRSPNSSRRTQGPPKTKAASRHNTFTVPTTTTASLAATSSAASAHPTAGTSETPNRMLSDEQTHSTKPFDFSNAVEESIEGTSSRSPPHATATNPGRGAGYGSGSTSSQSSSSTSTSATASFTSTTPTTKTKTKSSTTTASTTGNTASSSSSSTTNKANRTAMLGAIGSTHASSSSAPSPPPADGDSINSTKGRSGSLSRVMLPEPPVGMPILTPVEMVSYPAWSVSAANLTCKLDDESCVHYTFSASSFFPAAVTSSFPSSSQPSSSSLSTSAPSASQSNFRAAAASTSNPSRNNVSVAPTNVPGSATMQHGSSTNSRSSAKNMMPGLVPTPQSQQDEITSGQNFAANRTLQHVPLSSTTASSASAISSGHSSTHTSPYSPRSLPSPTSPNSHFHLPQISKFVAIQPGRSSLHFLLNPPADTTKLMVLSALVESDALNTLGGPSRKVRGILDLPIRCLVTILSFASLGDIYSWSQVSHVWAHAARSIELWKPKCEREISASFVKQLLPRIAPSVSNDAFRLVYRWNHPPMSVSQAPCVSCGSSSAQRLANIFVCTSCKKPEEHAVLTKRQLSLQFHLSSIDVQEYFPARLHECNALVKCDVMLAIGKKRRKMLSGQLRRARLSDHHKYHAFFNDFTTRKTIESNEEETNLATNLVRDFKRLLIEEAKLWVQRNPSFHRAWAIACQNEQGIAPAPAPAATTTSENRMSIDFKPTSSQPTYPHAAYLPPQTTAPQSSAMEVDATLADGQPMPEFTPFRYPPSSFNSSDYQHVPMPSNASMLHIQQLQYAGNDMYGSSAPFMPIQSQQTMDGQNLFVGGVSSYVHGYASGMDSDASRQSPAQDDDFKGNFLLTGTKTTWALPKPQIPGTAAYPVSFPAAQHSIHTASYHPGASHAPRPLSTNTRVFGDPSMPLTWNQPAPAALSSSAPASHLANNTMPQYQPPESW